MDWIKKDLYREVKALSKLLEVPGLLPETTKIEVARMEGKIQMAYMCDVITLEEKRTLCAQLQRSVSL